MAYSFETSYFKPQYLPKVKWLDEPQEAPEEYRALRDALPREYFEFPQRINPYLHGTKAQVNSKHKVLPDIFPGPGRFNCSPRFKALIEELEPNVHEFIHFDICLKDGTPVEGGYYQFQVLQLLDSMIPERSTISFEKPPHSPDLPPRWSISAAPVSEYYTLDKEQIEGKHLWWEQKTRNLKCFCSDTFYEAYHRQDMQFLEFKKIEEA